MSLLHKEFHTSDYNFYCPDLSKSINYVFVDKTKTNGKMRLVFLNTNEVSDLEYRKKLCDCLKNVLTSDGIKNIRCPNKKDFVIIERSAKVRSKFIKYFDDDFNFPNLGKFNLREIISQPTELDKNVANKINSTNHNLIHGVKLLPEKWKQKFVNNESKIPALQSQDIEFIKIYDEIVFSTTNTSKEESAKQKSSQEKLKNHDLEYRKKGLKKLHKQILTIDSSIDKLVTEYNDTIAIINNYMSDNAKRFSNAEFKKPKIDDDLDEFLKHCIHTENNTTEETKTKPKPADNTKAT